MHSPAAMRHPANVPPVDAADSGDERAPAESGELRAQGAQTRPENRELVSRAIALLARRDLSRAALIARLLKDGFDRQECEMVSRWCEASGFLNEQRHAESMARRLGVRYGSRRVAIGMRQKGLGDEAVAAAVAGLDPSEVERARALLARRFEDGDERLETKAKKHRFLLQRGFSGDTIRLALKRGD